MKYHARLINKQGCTFDYGGFRNFEKLKKWARNRGDIYNLIVDVYKTDTADFPEYSVSYEVHNSRIISSSKIECVSY